MVLWEENFIFYPDRSGSWAQIENDLDVEEIRLVTSDEVQIHGIYASVPEPRGVFLYYHGNASNLITRYPWLKDLNGLGMDVFAIDYRGYGRSEDRRPKEKKMYLDAAAAYNWIRENRPDLPLVIYGSSLGGAPATWIAEFNDCAGLVLQSTMTSARHMGRLMFPLLPLPMALILRSKLDNLKRVQRILCPKMIVHGTRDEVIPFQMGEALFEAAAEPKTFHAFEGAQHHLDLAERQQMLSYLDDFLAEVLAAKDDRSAE